MQEADLAIIDARATASQPTPREEALLRALSEATRALDAYTEALVSEVRRQEEIRRLYDPREEKIRTRPPVWEKSPEQEEIEEKRREARAAMQLCMDRLTQGRMYTRAQIAAIMRDDGQAKSSHPDDQAIGQADVLAALAGLENNYARQAFHLALKEGCSVEVIAERLHTDARSVRRLVNIALNYVDYILNAPIVAEARSRFMNFCLTHGLEFPEYVRLRGGA